MKKYKITWNDNSTNMFIGQSDTVSEGVLCIMQDENNTVVISLNNAKFIIVTICT